MALQIRTKISGNYKFLDIYGDEPVNMSLSFAEISDITQKNSAFSQSFKLPGTKNNNEIFNYFYNLNSTPLDFDPNNKFETILLWDGYEVLQGNIRLDSVTIDKDEIIYQVTFYNQVGDLAANIGDKFLFDLDLTYLDHPWSENVVLQSVTDYNLFPLTATTNYSYQNGKTMWSLYNIGYDYISGNSVNVLTTPLVQFSPFTGTTPNYKPQYGYFDFTGTPVHDYYYKPTIQIKELYTAICNQAGYEVESDFFNTSYFERFYMPLKFLDDTIYSRNAQIPCFTYTNSQIEPTSGGTFTNPISAQTCNSLGLSANTTTVFIPAKYQGVYTARITYSVFPDDIGCQLLATNYDCGAPFIFDYYTPEGVQSSYLVTAAQCFLGELVPGCCPSNFRGSGIVQDFVYNSVSLNFSGANNPTRVLRTDSSCDPNGVQVSFEQQFSFTGASELKLFFTGFGAKVYNFQFEIINGPRFLIDGQNINYNIEFPPNDYKQIDFISSINRYFNFVVVPSPDKPRTLIVEPIIDYIGKGEVLDWTTKIDYSQPQSIAATTSMINGTLDYEFKLDQDYANQNFKTQSNRIFGTKKINLNLEFKNQTTKFDYMFSSPIDITINSAYESMLTLSSFSKVNTQDSGGKTIQTFTPFKILPRLVFRGVTLPNDNYGYVFTVSGTPYQTYYINNTSMSKFNEINRFTTYPFNFNNFSHYTNFRSEDQTTILPAEFTFVNENLYDIYYKEYIEDLISTENKIFKAKIYLYPKEIQELRFNEKILINNSYFRINSINNYNLLEPGICDIELIKITKDYTPHRVLYYELSSCSGGTTLYSNSDLNYNLYAYNQNYVKLYNDSLNYLGNYSVSITTYDPTHDYQHYYLDTGSTNNLVGVFADCSCTGRTPFNIVQEEPALRRYYYTGTRCEDGVSQYFYSYEPNLPNNKTILVTNYDVFADRFCVNNVTKTSVQGYSNHISGYTFDSCIQCENAFPTPTPTATPLPTPTPTPIYYKLNACSGGFGVVYTAITPGVTNQRYFDYTTSTYYVWDNTTTSVPGVIGSVNILSGQSGCP
jgi:hypothetical protein